MQQKAFGRRANTAPPPRRADSGQKRLEPVFAETAAVAVVPATAQPEPAAISIPEPSLEEELDDWKSERRRTKGLVTVPWRPVYLMASLCFGIASFVLPDSVNAWVDWLLYALCAASLFAWFRGRPKTAAT